MGVPADKISGLFSRFSQVDMSSTKRYGGAGLGLAIARYLAELMGAEIGVQSKEREGSLFWLHLNLPLSRMQQADAPLMKRFIPIRTSPAITAGMW